MTSYLIKFNGTTIGGEFAENKIQAFDFWWKNTFGNYPNPNTLIFQDGVCKTKDPVEIYPIGYGIISIVKP